MFITFEGPDGSGKSSQISQLAVFLRQQGYAVLETREPGGTSIGNQVRSCLHDVTNTEMSAETELLLYSASRAQLVTEVIRPALEAGKIVLCDRYADSTLAYQGYGRGLDLKDLANITRFATGGLKPDLTLLLDLEVEHGLARRIQGGQEMNRIDLEGIAFHQRIREGFHKLVASEPNRWIVLDADRPKEQVQADMRRAVLQRLQATQRA